MTATEERPVGVTEQDQALDFFHGLDQGRYVQFKTSMLNGWVTKAFDPPEKPNNIYRIEGAWVKLTLRVEGGTTATFVTIEEEARINKKRVDKNKRCQRTYCTLSALDASNQDIIPRQRGVHCIWTIRNKRPRQVS